VIHVSLSWSDCTANAGDDGRLSCFVLCFICALFCFVLFCFFVCGESDCAADTGDDSREAWCVFARCDYFCSLFCFCSFAR
jgi:hypothetical protein